MLKPVFLFFFAGVSWILSAQIDSSYIRKAYQMALTEGRAYEDLRSLCKDIGPRLSGSAQAEMAVEWSFAKMKSYGFDEVYKQEIKVPHWERGTKEAAWIKLASGKVFPIDILALGGSVGTNGLMNGELVVFNSLDELKAAKESKVKGKIVLVNQPMDQSLIHTFMAYGGCYNVRSDGAVEASKLGAIAVLIRSLAIPLDDHPHTGSMHYSDSVIKIPAAAVSTSDCEMIARLSGKIEVFFEMDCRTYPDVTSYNVIADLKGSEHPDQIILCGGHLDSWDAGEGAHDDGAGVIHCLEALRIMKALGYKPKHTIRVVFFMNEENGNKGGLSYATQAQMSGEKHLAALESDRGGFVPRGFSMDGNADHLKMLTGFETLFKGYDLHNFDKGYGGVDIGPLRKVFPDIALMGLVIDSQRYFDVHHAASDVFEAVNKRELELGCAAVASIMYLLDQHL